MEPEPYLKAICGGESAQWMDTIGQKVKFLDLQNTRKRVSCLQDHKIIGCKWVFKVKEDQRENETLGARFKACPVVEEYF